MKVAELEDKVGEKVADKLAFSHIQEYGTPVHYGKLMEDIKRLEVDENCKPLDIPGNEEIQNRIISNLKADAPERFITFQFYLKNEKVDVICRS